MKKAAGIKTKFLPNWSPNTSPKKLINNFYTLKSIEIKENFKITLINDFI